MNGAHGQSGKHDSVDRHVFLTIWGYQISDYPEGCGVIQLDNGCLVNVFVWNIF